jgi:polysaccharide biosynthesis transport protein
MNKKNYKDDSVIDFYRILILFINNIKIFFLIEIVIIIITFIYLFFIADPLYRSSAKVTSANFGNNVTSASGIAAQFGISIPGKQSNNQWVYPEIIRSKKLLRKLLDGQYKYKAFSSPLSLLRILTHGESKAPFSNDTLELIALQRLDNMITITENIRTNIFTISIDANDSKFAKSLLGNLILELQNFQKDYNKSIKSETKKFIISRITSNEIDLKKAEELLRVFRDTNRRISNSPALLLEEERLMRDVAVLTSVYTTLRQQLEETKIDEKKDSNLIVFVDNPEEELFPLKPNKKLILLIAILICFVVFLLTILTFEEYKTNITFKNKVDLIYNLVMKKYISTKIKG